MSLLSEAVLLRLGRLTRSVLPLFSLVNLDLLGDLLVLPVVLFSLVLVDLFDYLAAKPF